MHYTDILDIFSVRGHSRQRVRGFTLVELLLAVAILGTLSAIAVPTYNNYIDNARNSSAIADIRGIEVEIMKFQAERGRPPNNFADAGLPTRLDPWGRPYQYLRLQFPGIDPRTIPGHRKDKSLNPLNADFDLYSIGKDGNTAINLNTPASHDDIVRANNGAFVGLGSEY